MHAKNCLIYIMIGIVLLLPTFSSVSAQENITVEVNMLGEEPRTLYNSPVMVAGVWHIVGITIENHNFQNINLKFYSGSSIPSSGNQDESNYYEWRYNSNTQQWTDLKQHEGYTYINATNSEKTDNTYSFCIGIKDTFPDIIGYNENWTLDVYTDGDEVYSQNIVIEKPSVGLSKSHDDLITFRVDPFTETDIAKDDPSVDEYFIIGNQGNIPLVINVNYGTYSDLIDVANSGERLSPSEKFNHYLTLHTESWPAGILSSTGIAFGEIPEELLITTSSLSFEPSISIDAADVEIRVGYSNYIIQQVPGTSIVFQYEESLEMYEGQIRDIKVYISGDGTVNLDIWADEINVEILSVSARDQTGIPMTIRSTNTSEYAVTIEVEAIRENKVGEITYELEIDGKYHTYTTEITIGPPREEDSQALNLPVSSLIIGFLIIAVVGYMISIQIRHRRK